MKSKANDVPLAEGASGWEVFKFKCIGWLVCLFTGNLWKYDLLVAQARHETGNFTSRQFKEGRNAFGMMYPDPYASGAMEGSDGQMCRYDGYASTWRGRLAWDDRHGVARSYGSLREYLEAVQGAGYNPDAGYVDRVLGVYKSSTGWITKMVNAPADPGGWFGKFRIYLWLVMLILLLVVVLYMWQPWRRRK